MIPLTFIAVAWIFNPSVVNFGELSGFPHVDGSSFFSDIGRIQAGGRFISPTASC